MGVTATSIGAPRRTERNCRKSPPKVTIFPLNDVSTPVISSQKEVDSADEEPDRKAHFIGDDQMKLRSRSQVLELGHMEESEFSSIDS